MSLLARYAARNVQFLAPQHSRSIIQTILHGSPEAKKAGELDMQQHSKLIARGKYIHAFEKHKVNPNQTTEYKKAAEKYYTGLINDPELHVKLTGSWETAVGPELDTFLHVLEFENYSGYDQSIKLIQEQREHQEALNAIRPYLISRSSQLCQEFAFFPSSPPHDEGGIFELRSYSLKPGSLLEWENAWRVGIEARKRVIAPVGAWFSQVGRLHQVHHIWQYNNLDHRREMRERAWSQQGWPETVVKTARLVDLMDTYIMTPLSWSPLK